VALNLIYADRDNSAVTQVMIHPDASFDTEASAARAGKFFALKTTDPQSMPDASFHAALKRTTTGTERLSNWRTRSTRTAANQE